MDVIHTDGGFYGYFGHTTDVSFYPNGGTRFQPSCSRGFTFNFLIDSARFIFINFQSGAITLFSLMLKTGLWAIAITGNLGYFMPKLFATKQFTLRLNVILGRISCQQSVNPTKFLIWDLEPQ